LLSTCIMQIVSQSLELGGVNNDGTPRPEVKKMTVELSSYVWS
jgi:hypothetical protein